MKRLWFFATAGVMAGLMLAASFGLDPFSRQWTEGTRAVCGDGIDDSEDCDDGNTENGDGCSDACAVESGWTCEAEFPSVCTETCGDGAIVGDEECDDSDATAGDGCSDTCVVESGWTCEGEPSTCETTCGDGVTAGEEECDDSGVADDDGCSATCTVEEGWTCNGDPSVCQLCGNGLVEGTEECDDDDTDAGDGCSATCTEESGWSCAGEPSTCTTTCGDNIRAGAEECDYGDVDNGDGCTSACALECGDASIDTDAGDAAGYTEACDDGNNDGGDGCTPECRPEIGYTCVGTPSVCRLTTGGSSGKFRPETAPYERTELRAVPTPLSQLRGFEQYRTLFSTSLSTAVVNLILANVDWPDCGGRSRRAPEIASPPLSTSDRGSVLARVAANLCLTGGKNPVPYKDFDPRSPSAQAVRALFREGLTVTSFDKAGMPEERLAPDRPISFLELTSLITQLRKRGFIDWLSEE